MSLLDAVLAGLFVGLLLGELWGPAALLGLFLIWMIALHDSGFRLRLRRFLDKLMVRPGAPARVYTILIRRVLRRIDRWLIPQNIVDHGREWTEMRAPDRAHALSVARRIWGWPLFDRALLLAFVYPIAAMISVWIFAGVEGRLGDLPLLPEQGSWWERLTFQGLTIGFVFAVTLSLQERAKRGFQLVLLAIAFAFAVAVAVVGSVTFAFAFALALAGLAALSAVLTSAGALAGALAAAFAAVLAAALVAAGALAGALAAAFASVLAAALAAALAGAFSWGALRGRGGLAYLLFTFATFASFLAAGRFGDLSGEGVRTLLIFFGVIPLTNACLDFVSIGLTRYLLRAGTRGPRLAVLYGFADLVAALVFFTLLGCVLIALVQGLSAVAGAHLFDLDRMFREMRDPATRWDYLWVYLMIFSTIVPTFLHFSLATLSALSWVPLGWPGLAGRALANVEAQAGKEPGPMVVLAGLLTLTTLICLAVPTALIGMVCFGLWSLLHWWGQDFLSIFELWSAWLASL